MAAILMKCGMNNFPSFSSAFSFMLKIHPIIHLSWTIGHPISIAIFTTLFHNFFILFLFFSSFFYMEGFHLFSKPLLKGDFLTLLDFPLSFHHTPNLVFWTKLAIPKKPHFTKVMGDCIKRDHNCSSFFQENDKAQEGSSKIHTYHKVGHKRGICQIGSHSSKLPKIISRGSLT